MEKCSKGRKNKTRPYINSFPTDSGYSVLFNPPPAHRVQSVFMSVCFSVTFHVWAVTCTLMDYHVTWYKCCLQWWDDVQWPWPGSIPQKSRSQETFKGQNTHVRGRAITYKWIDGLPCNFLQKLSSFRRCSVNLDQGSCLKGQGHSWGYSCPLDWISVKQTVLHGVLFVEHLLMRLLYKINSKHELGCQRLAV